MSDETSTDNGASAETVEQPNTSTPAQNAQTETTAEKDYGEAIATLAEQNKQLSKVLGGVQHELKKLAREKQAPQTETATKPEATEAPGVTESHYQKVVEELKARIDAEDEARKVSSLQLALAEVGAINPKKFAEVVLNDVKENLIVDESREVFVKDGALTVPVSDFVKTYAQSDKGRWILPPLSASSQSVASTSSKSHTQELSVSELNNLSPEDLFSGNFKAKI